MAASVYGGSPHHDRIVVHNQNGLLIPQNLMMAEAHYSHHSHTASLLKHSTALSSGICSASPNVLFAPALKSYASTQPANQSQHHQQQQQQQQQQPQQHHHQQQFNSLPTYASQHQVPPQLPKKTRPKPAIRPLSTHVPASVLDMHSAHHKRKSAVELLAESKPYYVKSETVLDHNQQLLLQMGRNQSAIKRSNATATCLISPTHTFPHQRSNTLNNRRSNPNNSELLQMKLRCLIDGSASSPKETTYNEYGSHASRQPNVAYYRRPSFNSEDTKYEPPKQFRQSPPRRYTQELTIHASHDNEQDVNYPTAFLSPQSLPSHSTTIVDDEEIFIYCSDEDESATDSPITPPAEYAECNSSPSYQTPRQDNRGINYQRSYSHTQAANVDEVDYESPTANRTSYKSLPDLHTSQFQRNSPYSEYSEGRGNRSNKSNSSLNRDSGGSSGHYTHLSEPHCKQDGEYDYQLEPKPYRNYTKNYVPPENRRDSGSSTQHSSNSFYKYNGIPSRYDCMECDKQSQSDANGLLNFTTSVVPEAFQDRYSDNDLDRPESNYRNEPNTRLTYYRKNSYEPILAEPPATLTLPLLPPPPRPIDQQYEMDEALGTFKRQKGFRAKQYSRHPSPNVERMTSLTDDRKKVSRSKSDLSHRYSNRPLQRSDINYLDGPVAMERARSENTLEDNMVRFFERLGLPPDAFDTKGKRLPPSPHSSPVFFSDSPTIDSNDFPDVAEPHQEMQPYRPMAQTSIVERNARIIKWLVACRKAMPDVARL